MTGSGITHLRHVGIGVPDLPTERGFYRDVWGLVSTVEDGDALFLAAEGSPEQYALRLRPAPERRLDLVAFAVETQDDVDGYAEAVTALGRGLVTEPGTMQTPGGGYGFRFLDFEGRTLEISAEVEHRSARQLHPKESIPTGLSHVVLNTTDLDAAVRFYTEILGFKVSDWLEHHMCFLRCNAWHHTLALSDNPHASLNHVAWEMRGIDEYMRATGRALRAGTDLAWGPGRHGPGDNTFSYFSAPSGFVTEFTTELERIEDDATWTPRVFRRLPEESDLWGTAGVRKAEPFVGVPDPGAWTPPPF
jgi:catechol 2,3-dioxygenase-like lactoylglutathione lyase family enzyme